MRQNRVGTHFDEGVDSLRVSSHRIDSVSVSASGLSRPTTRPHEARSSRVACILPIFPAQWGADCQRYLPGPGPDPGAHRRPRHPAVSSRLRAGVRFCLGRPLTTRCSSSRPTHGASHAGFHDFFLEIRILLLECVAESKLSLTDSIVPLTNTRAGTIGHTKPFNSSHVQLLERVQTGGENICNQRWFGRLHRNRTGGTTAAKQVSGI